MTGADYRVQAAQFCLELLHHPAERRVLPVLDLDPAIGPPAAIGALAMFRHQPLQPHQAGVAEQVRPDLALFEVGQEDAVNPPRQQPGQVGLEHRQRQPAQILAVADQDVEGEEPTAPKRRTSLLWRLTSLDPSRQEPSGFRLSDQAH